MSDLTPMFRQYRKIKEAHRDCILMFRMGDFYEMFFEDAQKASRVLEITLTTRGKGSAMEAPMCGVPHHSAEGYIAKLVRQGYRVAINGVCVPGNAASSTVGSAMVEAAVVTSESLLD